MHWLPGPSKSLKASFANMIVDCPGPGGWVIWGERLKGTDA
jgi:hypothetical protein